jgi:pimeloyl-ACP methyl ester carboxylesterase
MPYADVNGQHIYYEDTGGDGPAVLLMPAFATDHDLLAPQVDGLRDEFRCVVMDARGFGLTPLTGPYTYWDHADDALALMEYLGAPRAFYGGASQGGFVAMRAALRAPERVLGIATIGTPADPEPEAVRNDFGAMFADWAANGPTRERLEKVASVMFPPDYDWSLWEAKWLNWSLEAIPVQVEALLGRDSMTPHLGDITVPSIVINGEYDGIEAAKVMAEGLANCEAFLTIYRGYHVVNLTHAELINGALLGFLRRHSR